MKRKSDRLYEEIARRYMDAYGQALKEEMAALEKQEEAAGPAEPEAAAGLAKPVGRGALAGERPAEPDNREALFDRPGLEERVYGQIRREEAEKAGKRKRYLLPAGGLLAACFLVAALLPGLLSLREGGRSATAPPAQSAGASSPSASAPTAPATPAAPPAVPSEAEPPGAAPPDTVPGAVPTAPPDTAPPAVPSAPPSAGTPGEAVTGPAAEPAYDRIPLNITLPANFILERTEQDREKTVYYLKDEALDDVVLALERGDGPEQGVFPEREELKEVMLNGAVAYGLSKADYSILALEKDGIRYVMTCKYDINTLVRLGLSIV